MKNSTRDNNQKDVLELRVPPIKHVKIALVGLGNRGYKSLTRLSKIPGCSVVALCDVQLDYLKRAQQLLNDDAVDLYSEPDGWIKVAQRDDIDLVYIATNWELHTPIAVYAMKHGKHVAVEVPAALTLEECWNLVDTAEIYQRHCMILENCNYDFFELSTLNMVQQGLLGELVHCEGAYIHDLRKEMFNPNTYWGRWKLKQNRDFDGNLYPTHGLGPIAHALGIHRGDRMQSLVSVSTHQFGLTAYAKKEFGDESLEANVNYKKGDMNTTIIKTIKGKTIVLQHDVTSPRPYSRNYMLSGTKGFAQKWPSEQLALEPDANAFLSDQKREELLLKYQHPILDTVGEVPLDLNEHRKMDYVMDYRMIYCLNHGLPLDFDVYDAAEWSSIVHLSRKSVEGDNALVEIPDFTRGRWGKMDKVTYYL